MRTALSIILLVFSTNALCVSDNTQEGSLNSNAVNSTVSSNNVSTDESVSNTYNGAGSSSEIPVGSAISPSYMSNGMDTCLKGTGGSLQTVGVGFSSGGYNIDPECNRRRDAKVLSDLGMKVAAIARMCQSDDVWLSMFMSGTPCPIQQQGRLVVGKRAFLVMKMNPELHIPSYGRVGRNYTDNQKWFNSILGIGVETDEEQTDDSESISDKFRSSLKPTG
jgi:hypothetical protein